MNLCPEVKLILWRSSLKPVLNFLNVFFSCFIWLVCTRIFLFSCRYSKCNVRNESLGSSLSKGPSRNQLFVPGDSLTGRTWWSSTFLCWSILQGVRPHRRIHKFLSGHGWVVQELVVVKNLIHGVTADLQERDAEAHDVFCLNLSPFPQNFPLSYYFVRQLTLVRRLPPASRRPVWDGVIRYVVPVVVQLFHYLILCVLMRDEEGRRCITFVWILQLAIREQSLVKVKVLFAHIVIERQHDHLGDFLLWQISWDVDSATTAIGKLADVWRTWLRWSESTKVHCCFTHTAQL